MAGEVEIIVKATDRASGALGNIGDKLGGLGKIALGVVGGGIAALGAGLALSVSEAMEAQEGLAQLNAVLEATGGVAGITADMALDLADSLSSVTRYSDDAILGGENLLLTFKGIGEDVFPEVTEVMLDMSTAMGTDLKSSAIQLGKALNDPATGMSALTRVGVTFTEEQQEMVKAMVEAGDVAGAQAIILEELQSEFGGSAKAAGKTLAGQLDILRNSFLNVAEGVGNTLLPIVNDFMTNTIMPLVPLVADLADKFIAWLVPAMQQVGEWLSTNLMPVLQTLWTWFQASLPIAIEYLSSLWTDTFLPAIQGAWVWVQETLMPLLVSFGEFLISVIPPAVEFLAMVWSETLLPAIATVWAWLNETFIPFLTSTLLPWLAEYVPVAIQALSDFWTGVLQPAIATVWEWMSTVLMPFLTETVYPWLAKNLPVAIQTLSDFWTNTLQPAITTVWAWITETLMPLLIDLWTWLGTTLTEALQSLSEYWTGTLQPALETVYGWIDKNLVPLFEEIVELFDVTLTAALIALSILLETTLQPAIQTVYECLRDNLIPIFEDLQAFWDETLQPALKDMAKWFGETITDAIDSATSAVTNLIGWVQGLIKWLAKIKVPAVLRPGSPTPFEVGLVGINEAISKTVDGVHGLSKEFNSLGKGKNLFDTVVNPISGKLPLKKSLDDIRDTIMPVGDLIREITPGAMDTIMPVLGKVIRSKTKPKSPSSSASSDAGKIVTAINSLSKMVDKHLSVITAGSRKAKSDPSDDDKIIVGGGGLTIGRGRGIMSDGDGRVITSPIERATSGGLL